MAVYDIIIIGKGPAGVSAALYAVRAGKKVLIIGKDCGALERAERIDNYYGCKSVSGINLVKKGISQVRALGAEIKTEEVLSAQFTDCFGVKTSKNLFTCKALILATGKKRNTVNIKGIKEFEGRGVSYCAVCDGFFYKKKTAAVLGSGEYAAHEAQVLANFCGSLKILTNGKLVEAAFPPGAEIITKEIIEITGGEKLEKIKFADGTEINADGLFIALGTASAADFAYKIGAETANGNIVVDNEMRTNIPNLYACGDCTGGFAQICKAVYEGAVAGKNAGKITNYE